MFILESSCQFGNTIHPLDFLPDNTYIFGNKLSILNLAFRVNRPTAPHTGGRLETCYEPSPTITIWPDFSSMGTKFPQERPATGLWSVMSLKNLFVIFKFLPDCCPNICSFSLAYDLFLKFLIPLKVTHIFKNNAFVNGV